MRKKGKSCMFFSIQAEKHCTKTFYNKRRRKKGRGVQKGAGKLRYR